MARGVYITALGPSSGKSIVALGLMEMLSARFERVGFFRPIVNDDSGRDEQIDLIRSRYRLQTAVNEMRAVTRDEARGRAASGAVTDLGKRILEAYRALEARCDVVVCEGIDVADGSAALDFELDADVANHLGCPVLAVVRAAETVPATVASVRAARETLIQHGCAIFGVMVSRVPPEMHDTLKGALSPYEDGAPFYLLREEPELALPTVAEVAQALGAEVTGGARDTLQREVREVRVAAMTVEHFIDDLVDGALVLVPGDRADIHVASLAPGLPAIAGLVLTAGYPVGEGVRRLLAQASFPVLETPERTFTAAAKVGSARAQITVETERKVATALGLFEDAVDLDELDRRIALERRERVTPVMFEYELIERAKRIPRRIVLPEGEDERILRAAEILLRRGVVNLTILGKPDEVRAHAQALAVDIERAQIVDPATSPLREPFAQRYFELRKHKGMTEELARDAVVDPSYFGTLMVDAGEADGMVSGAAHTTADTIRPAFEIIKARKDVTVVSSVFLMCLADRVLVFGDCAVNPNPDASQLADIAISSAATGQVFGIEPRVAMLSYSTGTSGKGADVELVTAATALVRERKPDLKVDGPIQFDAAVDPGVAALKLPGSEVAGDATVMIFPSLETGNVAYKAVQRSAGAVAIGPVLQGLNRPVNDLSRGCTVPDIVNTVAITAIQSQTG